MNLLTHISNRFEKINKRKREERALKSADARGTKTEYLLSRETPFAVTEAFRNLKAALSVSVPKKDEGLAITITSAYPEDGKTTVTTNLAVMFAQSNAKVILVDADIRKGRVAKYFKQRSAPGLSDFLSGQISLEEAIRKSDINEHLSFIACGTHSPRPYELLESEAMNNLLTKLKAEYDYIIIDTPPIMLISDALALTHITDGTVLVCRHQVSYVSDIARALNTLQFAKANVLGVVVNDFDAPTTKKYYSNYKNRYYYSGNYTYGSTNPEEVAETAQNQKDLAPADSKTVTLQKGKKVVVKRAFLNKK